MIRNIVNNFANSAEQILLKISPSERSGIHQLANRFLSQLRSLATPSSIDKKSISKEVMFTVMDEAKELERKALFSAVHGAYEKFVGPQSLENLISDHQISSEKLKEVSRQHIERTLRKLCLAQGLSVADADLQRAAAGLLDAGKTSLDRCLDDIPLTPDRIERLRKDLVFTQREQTRFKQDYQKLKLNVMALGLVLSENPDSIQNTRAFNLCLLDIKRKALRNSAYQLLKTDETNPCVRFLHDVCLASYANTAALEAYEHIGRETLKQLDAEQTPLSQKLRDIYEQCAEGGVAKSNFDVIISRMKNFSAEVGQAVHAILSNVPVFLHLPRLLQGMFPKEDQRIIYENNPGALYTETLRSHGHTVQAHTVYTPGPTVGFEGSPEFRACLQAMENRQFTPLENDAIPWWGWSYTNLQDIASTLENPQSIGMMQLNEEFPFSYFGITIAQNTPMMMGKGDGRVAFDNSYKEQFLESLLHPDNYTLRQRKVHPGGGYYFPIPKEQQPEWEKAVQRIVEDAYHVIQALPPSENAFSAFRELSHLGLMSHCQKMFVDRLAQHAPGDFQILESHICRSGMDRGGGVNAELLYAVPQKEEVAISEDLVVGVAYARAFLARRRLLIKEFLERVADLSQTVPREEAQQYMQQRSYNQTTSLGIGLTHS